MGVSSGATCRRFIDKQGSAGSATAGSGSATPAPGEEPVPPNRQLIARRLARAASNT